MDTQTKKALEDKAVLEPKLVSEIKGDFFIPSYQRGYRWEEDNITMLLNDIWENGDKNKYRLLSYLQCSLCYR